jgi:hypothetical protein
MEEKEAGRAQQLSKLREAHPTLGRVLSGIEQRTLCWDKQREEIERLQPLLEEMALVGLCHRRGEVRRRRDAVSNNAFPHPDHQGTDQI